jgi:hypothetical protein
VLLAGLPDVFFSKLHKSPNLGNFWRVLKWKKLAYLMNTWSILQPFGLFYVYLVFIGIYCGNLVYFPRFGMLYQEKSGNPGCRYNNSKVNLIISDSSGSQIMKARTKACRTHKTGIGEKRNLLIFQTIAKNTEISFSVFRSLADTF